MGDLAMMEPLGELTEADFEEALRSDLGTVPVPLKELRARHHQVARLLAEGEPPGRVAELTGYSLSRISNLQTDPAFRELQASYAEAVGTKYLTVHEKLAALGERTIEMIGERLAEADEAGAAVPLKELREIAAMALDRSVAPPKGVAGGGQGQAGASPITIVFTQPQPAQPPSGPLTIDARPEAANG